MSGRDDVPAPYSPPSNLLSTQEAQPMDQPQDVIALQNLLKLSGMVASGGEAKVRIQAGEVQVNGTVETRRRRKLHEGDTVVLGEQTVVVTFDDEESDENESNDGSLDPDVSATDPLQSLEIDRLEIDPHGIDSAEPGTGSSETVEPDTVALGIPATDGDEPDSIEPEA